MHGRQGLDLAVVWSASLKDALPCRQSMRVHCPLYNEGIPA